MKKSSEQLFFLIKSLTKNEKRNFKLFSKNHTYNGDNLYLKLFAEVEKQKEYDEVAIKKKVDPRVAKNLPFYKNYLLNLLLQFIGTYHSKLSITGEVLNELLQANVLFQKGLYELADRILEKVKDKCNKLGEYGLLSYALHFQLRLMGTLLSKNGVDRIMKMFDEQSVALSKLENVTTYQQIDMSAFLKTQQKGSSSSQTNSIFQDYSSSPFLAEKGKANNHRSLSIFYFLKSLEFIGNGHPEKFVEVMEKLEALFREHPIYMKENYSIYANVVYNLGMGYIKVRDFTNAQKTIQKLKDFSKEFDLKEGGSKKILFRIRMIECQLMYESLNTKRLYEFAKEVDLLEKEKLSPQDGMYLLNINWRLCCMLFILGDYKECKRKLAILFHDEYKPEHELFYLSRVMELLINIERGDFDQKTSLEKKTRENALVDKFKKTSDVLFKFLKQARITPKESSSLYKTLEQKLSALVSDPIEGAVYEHFPIHLWAKSKSSNRPLLEVLKEDKANAAKLVNV